MSLTGQIGNIVKWQTSTDGGISWTDISNTLKTLDISNTLNNQQYRAVVNNGGTCGNVNSSPILLQVTPLGCPCLTPSVGGVVAVTSGILPLCSPLNTAELSLTGQVGNIVKWQTSTDGGTVWTDISHTSANYNLTNAANNQRYRAVVNVGGTCDDAFSADVAITVSPIACPCLVSSVGGTVNLTTGILPFPTPLNTGILSLSGNIGNIVKWQTSTDGGGTWTDIAHTSTSYSFANALNNQQYRAVVNNGGACGDAFSASTSITVTGSAFPCLVPSVGGVVALTSGALPLCSSSNSGTVSLVGHIGNVMKWQISTDGGTIGLTGQVGNIVKWQTSTDGGDTWVNIAHTTASYNFSDATNNQQFRVVVNNGGACLDAYSTNIALTVSPLSCPCLTPSVGGIVNVGGGLLLPLSSSLNGGNLTLTGQTGNIIKWQTSTDGGSNWVDIADTSSTYHFMNVVNNQLYRAVVNNGSSCADTYSSSLALTVLPISFCVEICNDGVDNDGNGLTDCEDTVCKPVASLLLKRE